MHPYRRFVLFCSVFALTGLSRGDDNDDNDLSGWVLLPHGFWESDASLRIVESGESGDGSPRRAVKLRLGRAPDWRDESEHGVTRGDWRFRFRRELEPLHRGGRLSVRLAAKPSPKRYDLTLDLSLRHFAAPETIRFVDGQGHTDFLLQLENVRPATVHGLYDAASGRAVDLSGIAPTLDVEWIRHGGSAGPRPAPSRLRISGRIPYGREVTVLTWRDRQVPALRTAPVAARAHTRTPARDARRDAARALTGWSVRGDPRAISAARDAEPAPAAAQTGSAARLRRGSGPIRLFSPGWADRMHAELGQIPVPYVEIGDGWQGRSKEGSLFQGLQRNWWAPLKSQSDRAKEKKTPSTASPLAGFLHRVRAGGFEPGLWILPLGQSERDVFAADPTAFVRDEDGKPLSGRFLGRYVVDPTGAAGRRYLVDLFRALRQVGCRVFRLAGLGGAHSFYRLNGRQLVEPNTGADRCLIRALAAIRVGAGDDALLLGGQDVPEALLDHLDAVEGVTDMMDRSGGSRRTRGEPLDRFGLWARRHIPLHGRTTVVHAPPIEPFVAPLYPRATFATQLLFRGITGSGVLLTRPLPEWAHEVARRITPTARVSAMDAPAVDAKLSAAPAIWAVPAHRDEADISVALLVNWSAYLPAHTRITAASLGVRPRNGNPHDSAGNPHDPAGNPHDSAGNPHDSAGNPHDPAGNPHDSAGRLLVFDLTTRRFVAANVTTADFLLLPGHSRLLSVLEQLQRPQLAAVSGHILATLTDARAVRWDAARRVLRTEVLVPGVDPDAKLAATARENLQLHIACPPGFRPLGVTAGNNDVVARHQFVRGHLTVTLESPVATKTTVECAFGDRPAHATPRDATPSRKPYPPIELHVEFAAPQRQPLLRWSATQGGLDLYQETRGFAVFRDGVEIGRTFDHQFLDAVPRKTPQGATTGATHRYAVVPVVAGAPPPSPPAPAAEVEFRRPPARAVSLDDIAPRAITPAAAARQLRRRRSVVGGPLTLGGERFDQGWGTTSGTRLDFPLGGAYAGFTAVVGVDDAARFQGSVVFVVKADGKEVFRSPRMSGSEQQTVSADVRGAQTLSLITEPGAADRQWDYANWCDPRLVPAK